MPVGFTDPAAWAAATFGTVQLGDRRRTARAVALGTAVLTNPAASLPRQCQDWATLKAAYRFLDSAAVTHEALIAPALAQTREALAEQSVVLFIHDGTLLDYSHYRTTKDLGPIGNGRGRGYVVHTVLATEPGTRRVLGLAAQDAFVPVPRPADETLRALQRRPRKTDVWPQAVDAIGQAPDGRTWVHVGDREADFARFFAACIRQGCAFLVRAVKDRRVGEDDDTVDRLLTEVRAACAQDVQTRELPASHGTPARMAQLSLTILPITIRVPRQEQVGGPTPVWVIRVWEADPPEETEPIEWILMTNLLTETPEQAWERVRWYEQRWVIEDFHHCLKTGCRIEQRHLGTQAALERLLGLCTPVAVELVRLREVVRHEPEVVAQRVLPADLVALVAALAGLDPATVTVKRCWEQIARRGGWLGRTGDGPPGWKTLWLGWYDIQRLLEGMRLVARLPPHA